MQPAQDYVTTPRSSAASQRHLVKRYLPLLLGAATGLVACITGLFVLQALSRSAPSPAATAGAICTDLLASDYVSLYGVLTPSLQQQGTNPQAEFSASQQELDIVSGKVVSCSYHLAQPNSTHATVTYDIARGGQLGRSAQVALVYQSGMWRIQDYNTSLV